MYKKILPIFVLILAAATSSAEANSCFSAEDLLLDNIPVKEIKTCIKLKKAQLKYVQSLEKDQIRYLKKIGRFQLLQGILYTPAAILLGGEIGVAIGAAAGWSAIGASLMALDSAVLAAVTVQGFTWYGFLKRNKKLLAQNVWDADAIRKIEDLEKSCIQLSSNSESNQKLACEYYALDIFSQGALNFVSRQVQETQDYSYFEDLLLLRGKKTHATWVLKKFGYQRVFLQEKIRILRLLVERLELPY